MRDLIDLVEKAEGSAEILDHLRRKYHEFNLAYFDGELPAVPIRWGNLKNAGAMVLITPLARGSNQVDKSKIQMVFSTQYQRSAEDLEPILLHEMIHVYVAAVLDNAREHHGALFMRLLSDLKRRSGIDIPLTDNTEGLELADQSLTPVAVLLKVYPRDPLPGFAILSVKTAQTKLEEIKERFKSGYPAAEVRIVTSKRWTEKAAKFPLQRNVNHKTKFWQATAEDMADLMANSEVLWSGL